jgi:hypothetical protein
MYTIIGSPKTRAFRVMCHLDGWAMSIGFESPEGNVRDYIMRVRGRPACKATLAEREKAA